MAFPKWVTGDSNKVLDKFFCCQDTSERKQAFDFIFSCPPYADLEVYSDLEDDISNKDYDEFLALYRSIIKKSVKCLKPGGYACFVVGDIRDKKGDYRDFVSHTKKAFIDAGAPLYNEAILLQPLGTAMLRAARVFDAGKKLTKVHENVLIFRKPV
jgi:methylase of polypeptide subunit release factors